jgi:hypothetical protein
MKYLTLIFLFIGTAAAAEEPPVVYATTIDEALRGTPGGSQLGSVRGGIPMRKLEVRGDWLRVSVEGWVKAANISEAPPQPPAARSAAAPPEGQLKAVGFEIETLARSGFGDPARVKVVLKIENQSAAVATDWSALLVAQTAAGEILTRTRIANGKDPIQPGATGEVIYYWGENEEAYDALANRKKEELRFSLYQVKFE